MARVTVEDCVQNVNNRFELVVTSAKRARQIANGADPLIQEDTDKPTVIALREIAEGVVSDDNLHQLQAELDTRLEAARVELQQAIPQDEED